MAQSKYYSKVKRYYKNGIWDDVKVRNAVVMGWITETEYEEITGYPYNSDSNSEVTENE